MLYGEQYVCEKCGWSNFLLRTKCRNCGEPAPNKVIDKMWGGKQKLQEILDMQAEKKKSKKNISQEELTALLKR